MHPFAPSRYAELGLFQGNLWMLWSSEQNLCAVLTIGETALH